MLCSRVVESDPGGSFSTWDTGSGAPLKHRNIWKIHPKPSAKPFSARATQLGLWQFFLNLKARINAFQTLVTAKARLSETHLWGHLELCYLKPIALYWMPTNLLFLRKTPPPGAFWFCSLFSACLSPSNTCPLRSVSHESFKIVQTTQPVQPLIICRMHVTF